MHTVRLIKKAPSREKKQKKNNNKETNINTEVNQVKIKVKRNQSRVAANQPEERRWRGCALY
jgi:hypothetical protein